MALTRPKYSQIYDTDWKQSVELATTADVGNLVLANVQPNSIDGVTVQTNYRILVKDQTSGAQNGIYLVRNAGTGSNGWWTRSLDAAQSSFVTAGLTVTVVSGTVNGGKEFRLTTPDPITIDVTPLTFTTISAQPGGANTYVQFNDQNQISGSAGFTFNKYTNVATVSGNIVSTSGYFLGDGSKLTNVGGYGNVQVATYLQYGNIANISVAGNVTATYFVGNGSQLIGLPAGYSNVQVATYFASGTATNYINTSGNISASTANFNQINTTTAQASVIGGITLQSGAIYRNGGETQVIGGGSQLTRSVLRLGNGTGATLYGGSASNNAPSAYPPYGVLIDGGDGNIRLSTTLVSILAPTVQIQGNITPFASNTYTIGNTTSQWNSIYATTFYGNIGGGAVLPNVYVTGSLIPSANVTYDLGSPTQKWRSAYFSGNTVFIGQESIKVDANGSWILSSSGGNIILNSSAATANIFLDKTNGWIGFNQSNPTYVFDFRSQSDAGELLHIESSVGTQLYFGAKNSSGLGYTAGADQNYAFSGTKDRADDYALITNNLVRANIQGTSGNVIFTESITVAKDLSTKYLGTQEFRSTTSNIFVRSAMTFAGTNLYGMGKVAIGTENPGSEVFTVLGGASYFDRDVTVMGNLFVNGNTVTFSSNNLTIKDSIIYLADNNTTGDILDIGFVGSFNDGVAYQHTGFVRDHLDKTWKLFANVIAEPTTNNIDFANATYSNVKFGNVIAQTIIAANFVGNGSQLTGLPSGGSNVQTATYLASGTLTSAINTTGNVLASTVIASTATIGNITAGNITSTGSINVVGNVYSNSGTDPLGYVYTMDDIGSQFDGKRLSFTISVNDGTIYSVRNPNQISLQIGGVSIAPTRYIRDYFNLTEVSVFNRGFYLQTGSVAANASIITGNNFSTGGNTIVFATAPSAGMSFYGTVRTNSDPIAAFTFKQSPFTALNIMLGP